MLRIINPKCILSVSKREGRYGIEPKEFFSYDLYTDNKLNHQRDTCLDILRLLNIRFTNKNYDVFCYINKKKQIALTKKNNLGFLSEFNLPQIKEANPGTMKTNWKFLTNYKNSISNIKLNINLYYRFSNKIPLNFNWYSIEKNKEFIPTFTKKIFKQVSILF